MMKKICSFLLTLVIVLGLASSIFAADASVTYEGHNIFGFASDNQYTNTDLFENFKGIMPGDTLFETITVQNNASCCDFIKVYIRAKVHSNSNQLSSQVSRIETIASMEDFLSKLTMTVWNGEQKIAEAAPHRLDGIQNNVCLGSFRKGEGTTLTVELKVPAELGNEYAHRVGEVDWVFVVEEYDDMKPDVPVTGDYSHIELYIILMAVSACGVILLLFALRRKKNHD